MHWSLPLRTDYWATSKTTTVVECPELDGTKFKLEFNPKLPYETKDGVKLGMYRLKSKKLPLDLMGYSPHKTALINAALQYSKTKTK